MTSIFRLTAIIWLFSVASLANLLAEDSFEFLIGDYLVAEGGNWEPGQSELQQPFGIDFDSQGTAYLIELQSGRLLRRTATGKLNVLCEGKDKGYSGDGKNVSQAQFNGPHNCVVTQDDQLLISDSWNHCVRRIDLTNGRVSTIAGTGQAGFSGDQGNALGAEFNYLMCIALNHDGTILHLADLKNRRIRNVDLRSGRVETVCGNGAKGIPKDGMVATQSPLVDPRAVASDANGNLYVLERGGHALRVVQVDGTIRTIAGTGKKGYRDGTALQAMLGAPKHICCDPDGKVYIADDLNGAIRRYDPKTETLTTVLGRGHGNDKLTLSHPHGVRWHQGWLYVVDTGNNRLMRIQLASVD